MVDTEKKRREKRTRRILLSIKRFMRRKWVFPPQAQKRVLHRGTESINDGRKKGKKSRDRQKGRGCVLTSQSPLLSASIFVGKA
jgi:hypothetical protein